MINLEKVIKNAEKLGYKKGFLAGRLKGFDQGLRFCRADGNGLRMAVIDVGLDAFLKQGYALGGGGRLKSTELYNSFCEWIKKTHPGAEPPTITAFGRRMGRVLRKSKSHGRIVYHDISRKIDGDTLF